MTGIQFHPLDTWFFRDGVPFAAGASPQDDISSLFPPHPPTLMGALRAALAHHNGWNGRGSWSREIRDVLGDGPSDLGRISVEGPFLLHNGQPLFRMPRHLLGGNENGQWLPRAFLRPGDAVTCDLGDVCLPELDRAFDEVEKLKTGDRHWITMAGMSAVLRGDLTLDQSEIVPDSCLWTTEPRIGLERCHKTRTAIEGMLYSILHVRLKDDVSVGARLFGLPEDWRHPFRQLVPFGGESRLAEYQPWDAELRIAPWTDKIRQSGRFIAVALTPLDLEDGVGACDGKTSSILKGTRIVTACIDRPQRIGGWDSRPGGGPLPLRSVLPAGSVLFCEISEPERLEDIISSGLMRLGARTEWGFGLTALGVWPDRKENIL